MRKKPSVPDLKDTLEHILTICNVYECSSDKVARIEQYSKHVLEEMKGLKKEKKNVNNELSSKTGSKGKRNS